MTAAILISFSSAGLLGGVALLTEYSEKLSKRMDRIRLYRKYRRIRDRYYSLYREAQDNCSRDYFFGVYLEYEIKSREVRYSAND